MVEVPVRNSLMLASTLVVMVGCLSDYRSKNELPQNCNKADYFEDHDEDGWGDPDGATSSQCEATSEFPVRNNIDCDDSDAATTGLVGATCPDNLVAGGVSYHAIELNGREIVAITPTGDFKDIDGAETTTAVVSADSAAGACGTGFGGELVVFSNETEFGAVSDWLDGLIDAGDTNPYYAVWVGVIPTGEDDVDAWKWDTEDFGDTEGYNIGALGYCNPDIRPEANDPSDAGMHLALIRAKGSSDWCFGFPSDVVVRNEDGSIGDSLYDLRNAHFLCQREPPLASEYQTDLGASE
ncbi:MAG: hypothetical protein ACI9MC_002712 [Kiritimatiellia bacterium]|jgi:hypothetical protein